MLKESENALKDINFLLKTFDFQTVAFFFVLFLSVYILQIIFENVLIHVFAHFSQYESVTEA